MKQLTITFSLLLFCSSNTLWNSIDFNPSDSYDIIKSEKETILISGQSFCFRLYIHVIQDTDNGELGTPLNEIESMLYDYLYPSFAEHNISFVWNGSVHYIDDPDIYWGGAVATRSYTEEHDYPNGINIYVFGDNDKKAAASGDEPGLDTYIHIGSGQREIDVPSHLSQVITHEMGHVLNLGHYCAGTCSNLMAEACENMNCSVTEWEYFSGAQVVTMKDAINNLDHLQDALIESPVTSQININVGTVCEEGWALVTASYPGYHPSDFEWEWKTASGTIWGTGNTIRWNPSGHICRIYAKATNGCGSSSGWKIKTIITGPPSNDPCPFIP